MVGNTVMMKLNRNFTVRSTLGHMITFKKGVPMPIVASMVRACGEVGAERVDGVSATELEEAENPSQPVDPGTRLDDVRAAIEKIVERNDTPDFTAGGTPKVQSVSTEVGYKVDRTEIIKAWQQRNEEIADASQ